MALSYRLRFSKQIYFMAKEELFRSKFFRILLNKVGAFPVSRVGNDIKAMKTALRHLKNKDIVGIFPEGTRYHNVDDEPLADFKQGAVVIAYRGNAPVIPCAIENASNFLKISKPAPIIRIGKPIYFENLEGKSKQEVIDEYTEICKKGILALFD